MEMKPAPAGVKLIGIGASTGGPPVLQTVLAGLPKNFAAPKGDAAGYGRRELREEC
jgi:chemotaxis response regulator CheB